MLLFSILADLRAHFVSHPLVLMLVLAGCAAVVEHLTRSSASVSHPRVRAVALYSPLAAYIAILVWYCGTPQYYDHLEPAVAAVASVAAQGAAVHPDADALGQYALPYGPLLFLFLGGVWSLGDGTIEASKALGGVSALLSLALIYLSVRKVATSAAASRATCLAALTYLAFGNSTFWVRAEPLLLLCVAFAMWLMPSRRLSSAVALGIIIGVAVGFKITAAAYFLPAIAIVGRREFRALALTLLTAVLTFAIPFALDSVSALAYKDLLVAASAHGIRLRSVPTQLQWAMVLAVPLVAALASRTPRGALDDKDALVGLGLGLLLTIPVAAKVGAGPYHFIPFIPAIAVLASRMRGDVVAMQGSRITMRAFWLAMATIAILQQPYWIRVVIDQPDDDVIAEIRAFERQFPGPIAVGYTQNYRLSYFRPLLTADGHPYLFDAAAMMDYQLSGRVSPPPY